jgi:hypothetical protein
MKEQLDKISDNIEKIDTKLDALTLAMETRLTKVEANQGWMKIILFGTIATGSSVVAFFSDKLFK